MAGTTKREIIYPGNKGEAVVEQLGENLNAILHEAAIAEELGRMLNALIGASAVKLSPDGERNIHFVRYGFGDRRQQGVFGIGFSPPEREKNRYGLRYLSKEIANGAILNRTICFITDKYPDRTWTAGELELPPYVVEETIPYLKQIFRDMGFAVAGDAVELSAAS